MQGYTSQPTRNWRIRILLASFLPQQSKQASSIFLTSQGPLSPDLAPSKPPIPPRKPASLSRNHCSTTFLSSSRGCWTRWRRCCLPCSWMWAAMGQLMVRLTSLMADVSYFEYFKAGRTDSRIRLAFSEVDFCQELHKFFKLSRMSLFGSIFPKLTSLLKVA